MRYLATPSSQAVRNAMTATGILGCIDTPAQSKLVPPGCPYALDNGKFGKGWPGADRWFGWLSRRVAKFGPDRCLWAAAPDVPFDAAGTLTESGPWLDHVRGLGVPVAFCAQNGSERPGMIPWDDMDVLFLAGDTAWKLSMAAADLAVAAIGRGKTVHMGRVNSETRFRHAITVGAATCDGTFLAFAPDKNLARLQRWFDHIPHREPPHLQFDLLDLLTTTS